MPNNKRAMQFMPFNGLKGYDALLYEAEHPKEIKREITEDHAARLNEIIQSLHKGNIVTLSFYTGAGYQKITCRIQEVNTTFRRLRTDKGNISFQDLWEIRVVGNSG